MQSAPKAVIKLLYKMEYTIFKSYGEIDLKLDWPQVSMLFYCHKELFHYWLEEKGLED